MTNTATLQNFLKRGLKLRQLRLLLALDNHRHVGRVADALSITQPAVSKALAELEQGLGVQLFLRTPKGLEPTSEGSCLARYAEIIEEDLQRAALALESVNRPQVRRVSLGVMHGGTPIVGPTLERLRKKHPPATPLDLTVHEAPIDTLLPLLRSGRLDIAVGAPPESSTIADLQVTPLYVDSMVWIISPHHPMAKSSCIRLQDLSDYIWVMTPRASRRRALVDAALRRQGVVEPAQVVETLSHETILSLVQRQNAVALVMGGLARSFESRGLVQILDIEMSQVIQVVAMTRQQPQPSTAALELLDCLAEQAASSSFGLQGGIVALQGVPVDVSADG